MSTRRSVQRVRRHRARMRGMTLLEAVVSVLVVVTGVAALMGMIINVENANRSMALQHASLDIFARLSAQIRDAECDKLPDDPVLQAANSDPLFVDSGHYSSWVTAPLAGSSVTLLGDSLTLPELADYVPKVIVALWVEREVPPYADAPPSFQIDVQIRELMPDPAMNNIATTNGYWIRIYPVQKLCNLRDDSEQRGEY